MSEINKAVLERNKSVVEQLTRELFNDGGDIDAVETLLSPQFVDHTPPRSNRGDRNGFKQRAVTLRAAFSEVCTTSDQLVAEDDVVCERYSCRLKHTGEFSPLPPTGTVVTFRGFAMYRVKDGQITEAWSLSDGLALLQQLGVVPSELEGSEMQ